MAWRNSPTLRLAVEATGAVVVLGLVDIASDLTTFTQGLGDEKIQQQIGPVLSHRRSLLAEEQQLHGEIDRHFVDALAPWLDPIAPSELSGAPAVREKTKTTTKTNTKIVEPAEKSPSQVSGLFAKKDLNYKEMIIKEFYEKEARKQEQEYAPSIEISEEGGNHIETSVPRRREIAVSDVQELFWNLLGEDIQTHNQKTKEKEEGTAGLQKDNMLPTKPPNAKSLPLEELGRNHRKQEPQAEDKFLLFPNREKFKEATKFPSLTSDGKPSAPQEGGSEPLPGPLPADAPRIQGDPSKTLICRLLGANIDLLHRLDVLEDDFLIADELMEGYMMAMTATLLSPEEAVSQSLRDIYLASIALTSYFYAVRKVWPMSGAAGAGASFAAGGASSGAGASFLAESRATASAAASSFLEPLLQRGSSGAPAGLFTRVFFSPLVLLPVLTMYASRVLGNPAATERWENFAKRIAYVHPSQLESLKEERLEKRGDEEFESLFAKSATPLWPGATPEDAFTWTRVKHALLSKPLAETVLYTGVLFRSLLQIPGLGGPGVAAANIMSAAVYGTFMTEHAGQHQACNWYEKEGGMRDYGLFRVAMAQQLALQCLYMTTAGTFLSLGRPLVYLMAANAAMLAAEMGHSFSSPGFRLDEFGPYRSLVELWVKNMQATYFRLSREPVEDSTRRLATHCAAYIFWLRGSAEPLRVARDAGDVVKEEGAAGDAQRALVVDEDLISASLLDERRYRQALENTKAECTLVDLHSFLVSAEHLLDSLTLQRPPSTEPAKLKPFEQWQTAPQRTLRTLTSLRSDAILKTIFGASATQFAAKETKKAKEGAKAEAEAEDKKEGGADAVLAINNQRMSASQAYQAPSAWGFQHLFSLLEASYRHAWFEFLKMKYRGRKLTFDEVETEIPKLLKMIETVPGSLTPGTYRPDSRQAQMQLLEGLVAARQTQGNFPSKRGMPSLLDFVPLTWDDTSSDITHEAMLDLVDGMYTRLRAERVSAAKAYGEREGRKFWMSRAGKGRPTRSDMARERDRMLRHVSAVTSIDCHEFLGSLGFTRYRLSLSTHRFSQRDSSQQLQKLTQSWEGYLKSKEHYEEVHKAFIENLMKGKPAQRYFE